MMVSIIVYCLVSWITYRGPFNLDRMLHRGIYSIDGEKNIKTAWTFRNVFSKLIGITPEYTRGDRIIAWSVFGYSMVYQLGITFILVVVWNLFYPWPLEWWSYYFYITTLLIPAIAGADNTVWFFWGGTKDTIQLFRDLEARIDNPLDDGRVSGQISLVDQAAMEQAEEAESVRKTDTNSKETK